MNNRSELVHVPRDSWYTEGSFLGIFQDLITKALFEKKVLNYYFYQYAEHCD